MQPSARGEKDEPDIGRAESAATLPVGRAAHLIGEANARARTEARVHAPWFERGIPTLRKSMGSSKDMMPFDW